MPHVLRDGVRLAYEERGARQRCFVFVHGWTCSRSHFAPQAAHFAAAGYRTVSVDLRGHGESDSGVDGFSIRGFAEDVAHVIDVLELGRPVAVGHSMGGLTVLQLAALHPDRVSAIVMVDPAPFRFPEATRAELEEMIVRTESGDDDARRRFVSQRLFLPGDDPEIRRRIVEEMCSAPGPVAAGAMKAILEFDGPAVAATCSVPVLHIAAEPALNSPELMAEHLRDVENAQTTGAGHFNQLFAPDQVNDLIARFARTRLGWS